jgi:Holliday junction resolvase
VPTATYLQQLKYYTNQGIKMGTTPEGKVKKKVKDFLDRLGVYHFSPPGMGLGRAGIPDIIACHRGRFIAIECKAGNNQPTALQARELDHIVRAGGLAFVVRESNVDKLEELIWTQM